MRFPRKYDKICGILQGKRVFPVGRGAKAQDMTGKTRKRKVCKVWGVSYFVLLRPRVELPEKNQKIIFWEVGACQWVDGSTERKQYETRVQLRGTCFWRDLLQANSSGPTPPPQCCWLRGRCSQEPILCQSAHGKINGKINLGLKYLEKVFSDASNC